MTEPTTESDESSTSPLDDLIECIREFVRGHLKEGVKPSDLSFCLTFVATEMGLSIAHDPVSVFPVVLRGLISATESMQSTKPESPPENTQEAPGAAPATAVLH